MTSKAAKKGASSNRVSSATPREAASIAASAGGSDSKRPKFTIWPEWNDTDVNGEKWEAARKDDKKGKSPTAVQHLFEDPDGKIEMPPSLRVDHWKRPHEFTGDKMITVVDADQIFNGFDLITPNEHLHESELMRYIISQITALWEMGAVKAPDPSSVVPGEDDSHTWKPWEHIYALCKAGKGPHMPAYNSHGKYVVRLYWMGCWRKIYVDDSLPFDSDERLLLPATCIQEELWPMLLAKALIKVASLDYTGGSNSCEFGDFSVVHCLTGWLPETIPLQYGHMKEVWDLLQLAVPEWKLPEQEWEKELTQETIKKDPITPVEAPKEEKSEKDVSPKEVKPEAKDKAGSSKDKQPKDAKDKDKGKDSKDDKKDKKDKGDKDKGEKEKDKHKDKSDESAIPEKPEVIVFASYCSTPKYPVKVSVLGEMADASERLRQTGLSHLYPHPVWITQTRSCPLEPPPPPEKVPAWKLIRPRKKKTTPSDEPKAEPEPPKPIQCLEITSPFVNYKVSPVPIPTDTHRPRSSLERGGTRSRPNTGNVGSIEETDETTQDVELSAEDKKNEELAESFIVEDTSKVESDEHLDGKTSPSKTGIPKKKSGSAKKEGKDGSREQSPKPGDRRTSKSGVPGGKQERVKSATRSDSRQSRRGEGEEEATAVTKKKSAEVKPAPAAAAPVKGPQPQESVSAEQPEESLALEAGEEQMAEVELAELESEDNTPKPKKLWVDFEQFCKCFKTLYIFHKPATYPCNQKYSDLKNVAPTGTTQPGGKPDKKPTPAAAGVNPSASKTSQTPTHTQNAPSPTNTQGTSGSDDRSQHYLFVDSLEPTEIVVSFSALPRWFDPPLPPMEEKKSHTSVKGGKDRDMEKEPTALTSSSVLEGSISPEKPSAPVAVHPGTLVAEPYSWKSLVTGQPILRLRSTATRAAVLSLPAGRHVLRFMMSGPLGYHVHLCSATQFVFGDEETVMAYLTNESCRFRDNAIQVINNLGKCINNLGDTEMFGQAWEELVNSHCPYRHEKVMSKTQHFQIFNDSLYSMLKKSLKEIMTPEMAFAWRALNFDATSSNIMSLTVGSRPDATDLEEGNANTSMNKKAPPEGEPEKVENTWANREPTADEHVAAVKIQKAHRGSWVRKLKMARTPGTDENLKTMEQLQKAWSILEPNAEDNGLYLFREMFKRDPDIMPKYPFYKDEWNKISYADYRGVYPDQPPNTWFIVFREVFFVKEEMLAVPKLYVPINTCMLRVVNNDTGEEIPRVFQKVAPYVYKKNRKGYTFVAEARTLEQGIMSGNWRMRLIGSLTLLPSPRSPDVNSSFTAKEIRDYYLPNSKNIIFRYTVKLTEDHLASLQVNTSKPDVYIKLSVLDHEEEVISAVGKGHIAVPSYIFLKDYNPEEQEAKRSSSRSSNRGGGKSVTSAQNMAGKSKRGESARSADGRNSRSSQHSEAAGSDLEPEERDTKPHKYIVQASVLKNSWPLTEREWGFVQTLKEQEKNELKVSYKERPPSPPKEKAPAAATQKGKQGKGSKTDKGGKKEDKDSKLGSRPPSQQFDMTKPFWTFRIVSDASAAEEIETRKDTERADEIRAMKKAWEDAEPGRAAKALQSRLKYLSTHMIRVQPEGGEEGKEETVPGEEGQGVEEAPPVSHTPVSFLDQPEGELSLEPPPPPTPKEILQPLDLTPFIKKTTDTPKYLDEGEMQRRMEERQQEIMQYKQFRERVEKWREDDRQSRNLTKIRQLEQAEELQAALDAARDAINTPREAFRQRYLEAERKKLEELAAQEAALKAEQEAKSPKGRKSAKDKKSPAGKKKK